MLFRELTGSPKKVSVSSDSFEGFSLNHLPGVSIDRAKVEEQNRDQIKVSLDLSMIMENSIYNSQSTKDLLKLKILLLDNFEQFKLFAASNGNQIFSGVQQEVSLEEFSSNKNNKNLFNLKKEISITKNKEFLGVVVYIFSTSEGNNSSTQTPNNVSQVSSSDEGQRTALIVLEDDLASNKSYFYTKSDDSVWFGPVRRTENGSFVAGFLHSERAESVTQKISNVIRVQDFRMEKSVNNLDISFSEPKDNSFPGLDSGLRTSQDKLLPDKSNSLFSDFLISKDELGRCRFFFSLDWRRLILENSPYQKVLKKNSNNIQDLLQMCKIQSFKLYRERVKNSVPNRNKNIFSPKTQNKEFDSNLVKDLIIQTQDGNTGSLETFDPDTDLANTISEVFLQLENDKRLRHFSGMDQDISQKSEGLFSYKIRLDVLDLSEQIIKEKMSTLRSSINSSEKYYNQAVYYTSTSIPDAKNFDNNTQFFSFDFIRRFDTTSIDAVVDDFVSVLSFFSPEITPDGEIVISNYFKSYLYPAIATPDSILFAINSMRGVLKKIEDNVNTILRKIDSSSKQKNDSQTKLNPPGRVKTFVVEKTFSNTFNASEDFDSGFDFFNTTGMETSSGLRTITKSSLDSVFQKELDVFYSGNPTAPGLDLNGLPNQKDSPDSIQLTQPSTVYFTPQKIYSKGDVVDISTSETKDYLNIISKQSLQKTSNSSNSENILSFLNDKFGVEVVTTDNSNVDPNTKSVENNQEKTSNKEFNNKIVNRSFETLYEVRKFVTSDAEKKEFTILNELNQELNKRLSDYDIDDKSSLIRKNLNKIDGDKNSVVANAPFQIKRLIFNNYLSQDMIKKEQEEILSDLSDSKNYSYFVYRTQTINKLMFLDGYELNDDGEFVLKKPKWVSVMDNPNILNRSSFSLCRSVPYENKELNVKRQKMFDLPTYDEYFIVSRGEI